MKQLRAARLDREEEEHLNSVIKEEGITASSYIRRLVREDKNRWEADALLALSVKDIGDGHAAQLERFREFEARFVSDLSEILGMIKSQQGAIEKSFEALEALMEITDANNTLLESLERTNKKIAASIQPAQR